LNKAWSQSGNNAPYSAGRHFLQIPGPTNTPERVLQAIARPTIDHRGPEFAELMRGVLADIRLVFQTASPVVIFPSSGTGAWEAALVNVTSPGDHILMAETGHFASLWYELAGKLGLNAEMLPGDWRRGASPRAIAERLVQDREGLIKAVCVVHNETSTGAVSPIPEIRKAIDETGHGALLMVDTISSLGSIDYRPDEWGVDVTVAGSQKGLMLPPGLAFNVVGPKAAALSREARMPRSYFDWAAMAKAPETGQFPYTPATNLLFGLREAIDMLLEEGLPQVFARHARLAEATRRAAQAWGLEILCGEPTERDRNRDAGRPRRRPVARAHSANL
jgi:alanine-glyoxylate transaminase/serine-glyoxylate transaminase/serine-pyruvate transaminase